MIDPLVSLAFALHSSRGAFALLLGSGVSRAAGVPTGWDVVVDLARRVAVLEGEDAGDDAAAWYERRFGEGPEYSKLLAALAGEPAERNRLLRAYFEPSEEEREQGLKVPTAAHRAIARLVRDGYVRVIVTTNFDRLLETALQNEGVVPTVLATADAVAGALPLAHTDCTIVKIHGDYLDARIRNTPEELAAYEPALDQLLDRIFDEYGLVICGWSADWDPALRGAIARCQSHRFTTFWASRGNLSELAAELFGLRRGALVPIESADDFFVALAEKVGALARVNALHPLSPALAAVTMKRYLPDPAQRIRLYDLVAEELTSVEAATGDDAFPVSGELPSRENVPARLERYEAATATLVKMLAVGGYWGGPEHNDLWGGVLDRLANRFPDSGGLESWLKLRRYPAVLALYAVGLGAVAADKLATLAAVLTIPAREWGESRPLVAVIPVVRVVEEKHLQPESGPKYHTAASDRLADVVLREPFREFLPHDERYFAAFDLLEYLLSLAFADVGDRDDFWAPVGAFGWRQRRREGTVYETVEAEARAAGDTWPLLRQGLFGGSLERFLEVKAGFDARAQSAYW